MNNFTKKFESMHTVAGRPAAVSAFEIGGAYNLLEGNLSDGVPVGIHIRGDGVGNFVTFNRLEQTATAVLDETGRAVVVPPEGIQAYGPTVPKKTQ